MANRNGTPDEITAGLKFGVEVEMIGLNREQAADIVARVTGGTRTYTGGHYDTHEVVLADGRKWKMVTDGSLSSDHSVEVVSPSCTLADMDTVQSIVRALREAGGRTDESCGLHVHVDAARLDGAGVRCLVRWMGRHQDAVYDAAAVLPSRQSYCLKLDRATIGRFSGSFTDLDTAAAKWYGRHERVDYARTVHYHQSRYQGLNLHSVWYRGTVEFRLWNGTMHAGEIRAAIITSMGIVARAIRNRAAAVGRGEAPASGSARIEWLLTTELGITDPVVREHMTKRIRATEAADAAVEARLAAARAAY